MKNKNSYEVLEAEVAKLKEENRHLKDERDELKYMLNDMHSVVDAANDDFLKDCLVLERGGRFFGDGVYMGAGGIFYSMNPKQDDAPVINTERVVIVDSVINTGKSIMRIIDELKNHNPGIDVIIAANVIQNEAVELFKDYLVFATRLSKNSFVGVNQSKQTGKTGPDTADRLFNLIKQRY